MLAWNWSNNTANCPHLCWKWSHEKLITMEVENYDFLRLVRGSLPLAIANGLDTRLRKHWVST